MEIADTANQEDDHKWNLEAYQWSNTGENEETVQISWKSPGPCPLLVDDLIMIILKGDFHTLCNVNQS